MGKQCGLKIQLKLLYAVSQYDVLNRMAGNANYLRMARGAVHKSSFPIVREGSNIGNGLYLVSDNDFKSVLFLNNILPLEQCSSVKLACI